MHKFGLLLSLLCSCSTRTLELASTMLPDADLSFDGSAQDAAVNVLDGSDPDALISLCQGAQCACANGLDDDGDGLIDGFDPECSYALDDESSFATGAHDEEGLRNCQDCFFDSNASFQDDGCKRAIRCQGDGDRGEGCGPDCQPGQACVAGCAARTPNGCDCFGCCAVYQGDAAPPLYVRLVKSCSYDPMVLADQDKCPRCVPSAACQNPCDECELCLGKTRDRLPARCRSASLSGYICREGDACDQTSSCPFSGYCYQGCCLPPLLF